MKWIQTAALLPLLLGTSVNAATPPTTSHRIGSGMLSGVALNATASTRTVTINLGDLPAGRDGEGWGKLRFGIQHTNSAATTVTAQFTCSYDGTTYYRRTTRSCASGTCSVYEQTDSNAVSGDQDFELEYDIRGCAKIQILLGGASAGASDLVTTEAVVIVGE